MTSKQFLPQHKNQLEQTNQIISTATENGWDRVVEMNADVVINLEKIITTLEDQK